MIKDDEEYDNNDIPQYKDITIDNELEDIHNKIDNNNIISKHISFNDNNYERTDEPITPESLNTVLTKYRVEAEIPISQLKDFEINRAFHGRHVALSNTKRIDNLRHLDAQDLCNIYNRIPTLRHRATMVRMRETAEFQMCRSNPEIGGFEAKIGVTNIRREDVDVKQSQSMFSNNSKRKRSSILGFLKHKEGG